MVVFEEMFRIIREDFFQTGKCLKMLGSCQWARKIFKKMINNDWSKNRKMDHKLLFLVREKSPGAENKTPSVIFREDFIFDSPGSPRQLKKVIFDDFHNFFKVFFAIFP